MSSKTAVNPAFAGLMHLREGVGHELLRLIALIRRARIADAQEHYTHDVLDALYVTSDRYNQADLARLTPIQMAVSGSPCSGRKLGENDQKSRPNQRPMESRQYAASIERLSTPPASAPLVVQCRVAYQPRGCWGYVCLVDNSALSPIFPDAFA